MVAWLQELEIEVKRVKKVNRRKIYVRERVLLKDSQRYTGVLGFTATIHSIFDLAEELFNEEEPYERLCTFFMLQDYLEQFFGIIRQHGGANDNPTAVQLNYIMRKLLVIKAGGLTPSLNMNCTNIHVELDFEEDEEAEQFQMMLEYAETLDEPEPPVEGVLVEFKKRNMCHITGAERMNINFY